jgi:hypothetical protein
LDVAAAQAEIARQAEVSISKPQLSKTLKKMAGDGDGHATAVPGDKTRPPSTAPGCGSNS